MSVELLPADLSPLLPYVPRLVIDWLESSPEQTFRTIEGTGVFADISGFTNLTERLARKGKVGAEEMGDTLNVIFGELLAAAYEYGAGLVKWGGDAVLLLFEGDRHVERAAKAAYEMQRVIVRIGRIRTSAGNVRLRMSLGIHAGELDFLLVGSKFRELILTGPSATRIAQMEKLAEAGEIVCSEETAAQLATSTALLGAQRGTGRILVKGPDVPPAPASRAVFTTVDLRGAFSTPLAEYLLGGDVEYEHRFVVVCFLEFSGVDALRAKSGLAVVASAVGDFIDACQRAAEANNVTFLSSDLYEDGGKVILISGAPVSAGDDAARILTAARQVLDTHGPLPVRAGINLGRVFAGDYGPPYRRVYSVTGDCVNLAARLMVKANLGEIVATPQVLARSRTHFETTAMDPFAVKGKSELIEAVLVGRIREIEQQTTATTPLIGRQREMVILGDAMASAVVGDGRVIELVGEAGIGKSRLLAELVEQTESAMLWADGDIYAISTPYQPLHRLFRQQLGLADDADHESVTRGLHQLITTRAPHLEPWLPLIAIVAGVDLPTTPQVDALDPTVRKTQLEKATSEALGAALTAPTLFIFNDVHFMDEATTELLDQLAADAATRPWLLIATRRPTSQWSLQPHDHGGSLVVVPLGVGAADDLLLAALGDLRIPAHRLTALVERAGGNPLFLKALAASVDGLTPDAAIPDSIEEVLASQIDKLAPPLKMLLRSAAVLGMTVDSSLLEDLLRADPSDPGNHAAAFADLYEFLAPMEGGRYQFVHHLVQETAYEGLSYRRRVMLHAKAADLIAERAGDQVDQFVNLLSLHCFFGERFEAAYGYAKVAGQMAKSQYATSEAAECYRRALASARHVPSLGDVEVATLCEELSDVYSDLGEYDAAEDLLRRARAKAKADVHLVARLGLKSAVHRRQKAQYSDSLRWVTRGRRAIAGLQDPEALQLTARLAELYAHILYSQGRHREAIPWADRAIEEARIAGDSRTQARAVEIGVLAAGFSGQRVDVEGAKASLALYAEINDLSGLARGHSVVGVLSLAIGDWQGALEHYAASAAGYLRVGRQLDVALMNANRAEILIYQMQLDEAETILAEAMRIWRGTNAPAELGFGHSQQARIAMARGDFDEALALFEKSRALHAGIREAYEVLTIDALIGECLLASGDASAALERVEKSMVGMPVGAEVSGQLPLLLRTRGLARVALGELNEGVEALLQSLDAARAREAPYDTAMALAALVEIGAVPDEGGAMEAELNELVTRLGLPRKMP